MTPHYSFIIPVYNVKDYLLQCVQSLLDQVKDSEIILVDDGSSDGSELLCDQLAEKNESVFVYHSPNLGASSARNLGVQKAQGEYIIFLDSDDFWLKDQFNKLSAFVARYPSTEVIMFDYMIYNQKTGHMVDMVSDRTLNLSEPVDGITFIDKALTNDPHYRISPCRFSFKKTLLEEHGLTFKEGLFFEDVVWVYELLISAKSVFYYPQSVFVYRRNIDNQITGSLSAEKLLNRIWISAYWLKSAASFFSHPEQRVRFVKRTSELYFTTLIRFKGIGSKADKQAVLKALKENKAILNYPNLPLYTLVARLTKIIGISATGSLFYTLFKIKNGLEHRIR